MADAPVDGAAAASVIICSRNRRELLRDTVASVLAGDRVPDEVIVVDQSDDADPALAALGDDPASPVVYRHTTEVGLSRARNTGARMARHPLLVYTDDDMLLDPGWLGALVDTLVAAPPRTVVSGRVSAAPTDVPDGFAPSTIDDPDPVVHRGRIWQDVLYSGNMAIRAADYHAVGGFDERLGPGTPFRSAEDNDLGYRLLRAGWAIRYEPTAIALHRAWRPRSERIALRLAYARGQGAFFAKHTSPRDPYGLRRLGRDVRRYGTRAVRYAPRRAVRDTLGDLLYVGGLVGGMVRWWSR